ncbi:MAG TPA: hypothetical protein VGD46_05755 [Rhizobacter sp.]
MKTLPKAMAALALLTMHAAHAADDSTSLEDLVQAATLDMPVTTAPAALLLGVSGETVQRMGSFRAFSSQAARAFDAEGKLANAVAVEIAPALAMKNVTWEDVTKSRLARAWARTTVSFATKAKTSTTSAQSAFGVQALLWAPVMDGVLDLAGQGDCVAVANGDFGPPPSLEPGTRQPLTENEKSAIEACQKLLDSQLTKWNQPKVAIGAGRRMASSDGTSATQPKNSTSYWLTAAYGEDLDGRDTDPTRRTGYLVTAHARSTSNATTRSIAGVDLPAKQRLLGVNLRFGNARLGGLAEYSVTKSRANSSEFKDRKRAVLGLEYKVDKDLYLTLGTARDTGVDAGTQSVLAKIHWGFTKEPALLPK